jgi:hypothetical protein
MARTIWLNLPEPEPTLEDLSPVLREIYQALQHGAQQGREVFELWGYDPEAYLFGDMVRFHAGRFLDRAGLKVRDDISFRRHEIRNNGLFLTLSKYRLKIWKADRHGSLPDPGVSMARVSYCRQLHLPFAWTDAGAALEGPFNLIVLWSCDSNRNIHEVRLVCPAASPASPTAIDEYWNVVVPDPVTTIRPAVAAPEPAAEVEVDDLDIAPLDLPETGTDAEE